MAINIIILRSVAFPPHPLSNDECLRSYLYQNAHSFFIFKDSYLSVHSTQEKIKTMKKHFAGLMSATLIVCAASMITPTPVFASESSQAEISALKAEINKLASRVDQLQKQETTQDSKVDALQEQAKQDSRLEPAAGGYHHDSGYHHDIGGGGPVHGHDWTGFYVGGNIGGGMGTGIVEDKDCWDCASDSFSTGFVQGGVHGGYNHQIGSGVFGLEAEINVGSQDHKGLLGGDDGSPWKTQSKTDWSAAILGRAGIAVDNTLFFVAAGPAMAHIQGRADVCTNQTCSAFKSAHDVDKWAGAVKGAVGAEIMVTPTISVRGQYSVLDVLDQKANATNGLCSTPDICRAGYTDLQQAATVGADFHF
jgi:opacity protein-like surface antigen